MSALFVHMIRSLFLAAFFFCFCGLLQRNTTIWDGAFAEVARMFNDLHRVDLAFLISCGWMDHGLGREIKLLCCVLRWECGKYRTLKI